MSYTKGPWTIKNLRAREIKGDVWAVVDSDSFPSAFVPAWTDNKDTAAEAEANAKLIAAAPELLEALEGLASAYEKLDGAQSADGSWLSHAKTAIAKAKS